VQSDDIVSETLVIFFVKTQQGEKINQPGRWLLATAKRKRLEMSRTEEKMVSASAEMLQNIPTRPSVTKNDWSTTKKINDSAAWQLLSSKQRFVIQETIMFGRPMTEVAAEANVNRSTAKSWVNRLLPRLASDPHLLSMLN